MAPLQTQAAVKHSQRDFHRKTSKTAQYSTARQQHCCIAFQLWSLSNNCILPWRQKNVWGFQKKPWESHITWYMFTMFYHRPFYPVRLFKHLRSYHVAPCTSSFKETMWKFVCLSVFRQSESELSGNSWKSHRTPSLRLSLSVDITSRDARAASASRRYTTTPRLRPYVSAISDSKNGIYIDAACCLQRFKLLRPVSRAFIPIDNTWACWFLRDAAICMRALNEELNWQLHLPNTLFVKKHAPPPSSLSL